MILPLQCLGAVIVTSFPLLTLADFFSNPPNYFNSVDGAQIQTKDLSTVFTFGQKVQISWFAPSLPNVSLSIHRWGSSNDTVITSFLTNKQNIGYYPWTIGTDDGIDLVMISAHADYGFLLDDPTGNLASRAHLIGFINNTLSSRGFIIQPNLTTFSSSSTLAPTLSTLSPSPQLSILSPSITTTSSASTTPSSHSDLSRSAVAGLATGLCMVSILALIAVLLLYFQRQIAKNIQAETANLVVRMEELTGVNSMRPGLQASLNFGPPVVELSTFPSFRPSSLDSEPELGNSGSELGNLTLSRQELSAERFSNQDLGTSRRELASSLERERVGSSGGTQLSIGTDLAGQK